MSWRRGRRLPVLLLVLLSASSLRLLGWLVLSRLLLRTLLGLALGSSLTSSLVLVLHAFP